LENTKESTTALQVGLGLLALAQGSEEEVAQMLEGFPPVADPQRVETELLYLKIFTADFVAETTLEGPARAAVRGALHGHLVEMWRQCADGPEVCQAYAQRSLVYNEAANTPHTNGPSWTIAQAFSRLCGKEMDPSITLVGVISFTAFANVVSKFLKEARIV
jgi:hypothetical protein